VLRGRGYNVLLARHGNDALELLHEHGEEIDILLTDLVMPEMPGTEVAARAREMRPGLRVLYMSGYSEAPYGMTEGDAGIPLVRKPFTAEELSRAVRATLDAT
jgi:CheY-like chemotaxis protein